MPRKQVIFKVASRTIWGCVSSSLKILRTLRIESMHSSDKELSELICMNL